jgi:hypothetical protein
VSMDPQKYSTRNVSLSTRTLIQGVKLVGHVHLLSLGSHVAYQFRFQCYPRIDTSALVSKLSVAFTFKCI